MSKKNIHEHNENVNVNVDPNSTPILYTDMVYMHVNEDGVTFDICQRVGSGNQFQVATRVGMSRSHAQKFAKKLSETLALTAGQSQTGEKN